MTDLETQLRNAIDRDDVAEIERLSVLMDAEDEERHARLAAPDALTNAAHWYSSVGIAIFPLRLRDKTPYPGSRGFKDATTDPAQAAAWWTARPDSNIGAPTGITFDVIDIDGETGVRSMLEHRMTFERIGRSATSRDHGAHIFIRPTGRGNGTHLFPGIDYRGIGGYVVLPPSVGANGRRYRWLQPLEVKGDDVA